MLPPPPHALFGDAPRRCPPPVLRPGMRHAVVVPSSLIWAYHLVSPPLLSSLSPPFSSALGHDMPRPSHSRSGTRHVAAVPFAPHINIVVLQCGCACGFVRLCMVGVWVRHFSQLQLSIPSHSHFLAPSTPLAPSSSMGILRSSVLSATTSDRPLSNPTSLFPYHNPFLHAHLSSSFLGPSGLFPPSRSTPAVDQLRQGGGLFWWVSGVHVGPARRSERERGCVWVPERGFVGGCGNGDACVYACTHMGAEMGTGVGTGAGVGHGHRIG